MGNVIADNDEVNKVNTQEKANQVQQEENLAYSGLSKHLLAEFNLVNYDPKTKTTTIDYSNPIKAILVDGSSSIESQWQTPFENSNPDHKLPALTAGLQDGKLIESVVTAFTSNETVNDFAKEALKVVDMIDPVTGTLKKAIEDMVGHTNLTKVNSQQIYLSTANRQFTVTIQFLAFKDARKEVELPLMLLEQRASPQVLAEDGFVVNILTQGLGALFPSIIPPFVSLTTCGKTFYPLVINSVSAPIKTALDENGNRVAVTVEVVLSTRTAQDATDIANIYGL